MPKDIVSPWVLHPFWEVLPTMQRFWSVQRMNLPLTSCIGLPGLLETVTKVIDRTGYIVLCTV